MTVPVRPWYTGAAQINTPSVGALRVLSVTSLSVSEAIDKIDTTGTGSASATYNGQIILPKTSIQAGTELAVRMSGQYGAGGSGDPPQFGANLAGGTIYGNQPVILQAGDTFTDSGAGTSGFNMLVDRYENTFTKGDNSPIEYNLEGHSNGAFRRNTALT